jgi:hypothetical protein
MRPIHLRSDNEEAAAAWHVARFDAGLSDVLVGRELRSGALVKMLDPPLPGFGFYFHMCPITRGSR